MVLWLRKHQDFLVALLLSLFFLFPLLSRDFVGIEHDTYFHLSRITGLAQSLQEGKLFPAVYPYKNNGFGYASPLFYNDIFLLIPALFYLCGGSLAGSYKLLLFLATFTSAYAMKRCMRHFVKDDWTGALITFVYLCNNYRITDVYVRSAVGEVMAFTFLPILITALYEILEHQKLSDWKWLCFAFVGLICCHNLTFFLGTILVIAYSLCYLSRMNLQQFVSLCKAALCAFLLTAWFTLPMLEQTAAQALYLHYYGAHSDLGSSALPLWKYFANRTVFGFGSNTLPKDRSMLLNVGYFLTFMPVTYFFLPEKRKNRFLTVTCMLGLFALWLPIDLLPWSRITILNILQFIWRLFTIAVPLLCMVSGVCLTALSRKRKFITKILFLILIVEGVYHLAPVYDRTFGITSETTYQDILDGKYSDPYYSATYMRVELAGGDYLPVSSPDFRNITNQIKDTDMHDLSIPYQKNGTELSFHCEASQDLILPITWYRGYQCYQITKDRLMQIPTVVSDHGLVQVTIPEAGDYVLKYQSTSLRKISFLISTLSFLYLLRRRKPSPNI